jgi:hypothetical protein
MRWIAEILPLCFVRWFALKKLERLAIGEYVVTNPRAGIFVVVARRDGKPSRQVVNKRWEDG